MQIDIVTPCFNQRHFLEQTMRSVLSQSGDFALRWIVVDGASTDGTREFLASITDSRVRWTSESDRGQAHALNKGLQQATGDIIGWLNSDDLYALGGSLRLRERFKIRPRNGSSAATRSSILRARSSAPQSPATRIVSLIAIPTENFFAENFIAQPAVFWRREFGQEIGGVDESLHYTMDYDLWLRMGKRADPLILNSVVAQFRIHSDSKSGKVNREQFDEGFRVAQRYFGDDKISRLAHRMNVEKIVWAYRAMRLLGI